MVNLALGGGMAEPRLTKNGLPLGIHDAYQQLRTAALAHHDEGEASRMARYILEDVYQITHIHKEGEWDRNEAQFQGILQQLSQNRPLQYITGLAHFYGHIFQVDERVLIPRPETEELVYHVLHHPSVAQRERGQLLDIGTGSGCIPISLKKKKPHWDIHASDVSSEALALACRNSEVLSAPIHFVQHDIRDTRSWADLPCMDVIVSNPPYIPLWEKSQMPAHVLDWEPHLALFTPNHPLEFYEAIVGFAKEKLQPHGLLFFELNEYQAQSTLEMVQDKGGFSARIIQDLSGKDRVLVAVLD